MQSNRDFVCEYLASFICEKFANLNRVQVEAFVIKLFNSLNDWKAFKDTLRDLLISMKSYATQDNDFYAEEKQVSLQIKIYHNTRAFAYNFIYGFNLDRN